MKDLDIEAMNGSINIEARTDGGIGIYYETVDPHNTIMISKDQLIKITSWIINYLNEEKK
jgi:hypothetical protein